MSMPQSRSWSRAGMRVIKKFAGTHTAVVATAGGRTDGDRPMVALGCCHLAYPSDGSCFNRCNGSYHWEGWGCCQSGSTFYSCGECTTGSDCYSGSILCSYGEHVPGGCA